MDHVYDHLKNPARVLDQLPDWITQHQEYSEAHFSEALTQIAEVWPVLFPFFKNQMVLRVLDRVTVHRDGITSRLHVDGLVELIREFLQGKGRPNSIRDIFDRAAAAKPKKPRR